MNILLFDHPDIVDVTGQHALRVRVSDERRVRHITDVLRAREGDSLKAGLVNDRLGVATVVRMSAEQIELNLVADQPAPPPLPITLLLALPRPLVVRRLLSDVCSFGVKHICLLDTARVEKSYWQSPVLKDDAIHQALIKGLEQARDTSLPVVSKSLSFKTFMAEQLGLFMADADCALIADPDGHAETGYTPGTKAIIAIGPEGGFVDAEIALFTGAGFRPVSLGSRLLRVETAVHALLGRMSQGSFNSSYLSDNDPVATG